MSQRTTLFFSVFVLLILERLIELVVAKKNEKRLLATRGVEFGRDHYWIIVTLHVLFFCSLLVEFVLRKEMSSWYSAYAVVLFLLGQFLRVWVFLTMRSRWTTRIIVVQDERLVQTGPYRFFSHPNYLAVALELLSFPMIFGLWITASVFTVLNGIVLGMIRIPAENAALRRATEKRVDPLASSS